MHICCYARPKAGAKLPFWQASSVQILDGGFKGVAFCYSLFKLSSHITLLKIYRPCTDYQFNARAVVYIKRRMWALFYAFVLACSRFISGATRIDRNINPVFFVVQNESDIINSTFSKPTENPVGFSYCKYSKIFSGDVKMNKDV